MLSCRPGRRPGTRRSSFSSSLFERNVSPVVVSRGTYPHGASGSDGAGRLNGHPKKCWVKSRWPPARADGSRPPVSRPTSRNVPAHEGVSGAPTVPCVRCLRGVARSRPATGSRCRGSPRAECFLRTSAPRSLAVPGIRHRIRNVRLFVEAASVMRGRPRKSSKFEAEHAFSCRTPHNEPFRRRECGIRVTRREGAMFAPDCPVAPRASRTHGGRRPLSRATTAHAHRGSPRPCTPHRWRFPPCPGSSPRNRFPCGRARSGGCSRSVCRR